jgi:CheY-like chemotaxis protein
MPAGSVGYMTRPVTDDDLEDAILLIESTMTFSLKKVLVVAENRATRERLLKLLHGSDLEISTAMTAQEAYTQVKQDAFDVIVLDLRLRDMSGFDLIDLLHRDPIVSYLPVITYSAEALSQKEQQRLQGLFQRTLTSSSPVHERMSDEVGRVSDEVERVFDEIILFLHQVEAELPEARQKKVRILHDRETVLRGKTILLVDDDMRNLYALTSTLEDHQMNVLMAVNGKEALNVLDEHVHDIHLVMMDMMMPEMDGYEAIRAIREKPDFSRLPIIALTARAMRGDRQKCIEAGANDYLSKPVDIDKLLSLLRVWLY